MPGQFDVLIVERLKRAVELGDDEVETADRLLFEADQIVTEAVASIPALARSRGSTVRHAAMVGRRRSCTVGLSGRS